MLGILLSNLLLAGAVTIAEQVQAKASGSVKPGENLVFNGRLESRQMQMPPYWTVMPTKGGIGTTLFFPQSGGPKDLPHIRMCSSADAKPVKNVSVRQYGLVLAPGGRYRLSAMVRTRRLKAKWAGVCVCNQGWHQGEGIDNLPADTDWTLMTKEFTMFDSGDGMYFLVIGVSDLVGSVEVSDVKLEAINEKALLGTRQSTARKPRLVPWSPRLHEIPTECREVKFRTFGEVPKGCKAALTVDGAESIRSIDGEFVTLPLPDSAKDKGLLGVRVFCPESGTTIVDDWHRYVIKAKLPKETKGRRLNNFVVEIANARAEEGKVIRFSLAHDGWVYAAVREGSASLLLDDREVVSAGTQRGETFRHLTSGQHSVSLAGGSARLIVRSIAATFNYPVCASSPIPQMRKYDWDFFRKYVEPAVCVQNGGSIPADKVGEFRARGGYWLPNLMTTNLKDAEDLVSRLEKARGLVDPACDGVTCDEQYFERPRDIERYLDGRKKFDLRYEGGRDIWVWAFGRPLCMGMDNEFAATVVNAAPGRAKLLWEVYCGTKATEQEADAYVRGRLCEVSENFEALYHDLKRSAGVILGNFTQVPVSSLVHHPEVDFKYYLDLQLNAFANDPRMEGVGCIGFWGAYYGDEEMYRWSMALLRHYAVEGRTDMLSDRYGYHYLPGHLTNGDFRGTLEGWRTSGSVKTDRIARLGSDVERRICAAGAPPGDDFAVLVTGADGKGASVAQVVRKLVPGHKYALQIIGFDAAKARGRDASLGDEPPVDVQLDTSAERDEKSSWVFFDRRAKRSDRENVRLVVHHIVFTAKAPEVTLSIVSKATVPGYELGVNGVCLNPYYEDVQEEE